MAVKERSQIKGTDAQIKAFAGHNGVLAYATDTKSLHVLSGTAGTTTEYLPSTKVATKDSLSGYATKADLGSYATSEEVTTELAKKANTSDVTASFAKYTPTANLATVATSGKYADLSGKPTLSTVATSGSYNDLSNKPTLGALASKDKVTYATDITGAPTLATVATSGNYNDLKNKPSIPSAGLTVVAESYGANSWYRKYSDGWIEQGGTFSVRADWKSGSKNVTLPIAFSSACYSVVSLVSEASSTGYTSGDDSREYETTIQVSDVTKTNIVFKWATSGGDGGNNYASVWLSARLYMCGK